MAKVIEFPRDNEKIQATLEDIDNRLQEFADKKDELMDILFSLSPDEPGTLELVCTQLKIIQFVEHELNMYDGLINKFEKGTLCWGSRKSLQPVWFYFFWSQLGYLYFRLFAIGGEYTSFFGD